MKVLNLPNKDKYYKIIFKHPIVWNPKRIPVVPNADGTIGRLEYKGTAKDAIKSPAPCPMSERGAEILVGQCLNCQYNRYAIIEFGELAFICMAMPIHASQIERHPDNINELQSIWSKINADEQNTKDEDLLELQDENQ